MPKTSCVRIPADDTFIMVRSCYLRLCNGNATAAALVHYFEHWHNVKLEARQNFIDSRTWEERRARPSEMPTLWQHHSAKQLQRALLGIGGRHSIDVAKKQLHEMGVVDIGRNPNPEDQMDNTTFFLFNAEAVNRLLEVLPPAEISKSHVQKSAPPPAEISKGVTQKSASANIDTSIKPSIDNPPTPTRASEHEGVVWPWDTETFWDAWAGWREYKLKQHKFVFKLKGSEQAALNLLRELSGDNEAVAHAIIRQSMANGWKGFFQLKNDDNNATHRQAAAGGNGTKQGTSTQRVDAIRAWGERFNDGAQSDAHT